jgi:hypothetical protein
VLARAFARNLQALRISWGQHVAQAAATRAVDNGATAHELMAIFGWVDYAAYVSLQQHRRQRDTSSEHATTEAVAPNSYWPLAHSARCLIEP